VLEGWALVETPEYSLLLPSSWKVHPVTAENAGDELAALRKVNPFLAQSIGSSKAMQDLSLWASDEEDAGSSTAGMRENMNVSRTSLEGEKLEDLQPVLDALKEEYSQGGAQIKEAELYTMNDQPALRVAYQLDRSVAGQTVSLEGRQYFFVSAGNLWILSYTAGPGWHESLSKIADLSARSFQVTP
jgi:hypothetical protein